MNNILTIERTGRKPGNRATESQDRILARPIAFNDGENGTLLAIADGITTGAYGGSVARWIVDRHLALPGLILNKVPSLVSAHRSYLSSLYATFNAEFADMPDMLASGSCLVTVLVASNRWACCSIGDCQAFRITKAGKGYQGEQITRPHLDRLSGKLTDCFGNRAPCNFNTYEGTINDGDVLVLTSDGAKLDEITLPEDFNRSGFTDAWLKEMADRAMTGRFWDDISIIAYRHERTNEDCNG